MPAYTAEQVAAAIAEPRVGDVWEKGAKLRTITRVFMGARKAYDLFYTSNGRTGAMLPTTFARWAKTATLLIRTQEADNA